MIVTVIDTGNYKSSYSEGVPFKATLFDITDYPCYWVKSIDTEKIYELYPDQVQEGEMIEQIRLIIQNHKS